MNLDPFSLKDSHRHIGSNTKLRLVKAGLTIDDLMSTKKEGLVRAA